MLDSLLIVHVGSAAVGFGTALLVFPLIRRHFGNRRAGLVWIFHLERWVVIPSVIINGLSGLGLMAAKGLNPLQHLWLLLSIALYAIVLVLVWLIHLCVGRMAYYKELQLDKSTARFYGRLGEILGYVAFSLLAVIVALMLLKPQ